MRLEGDLVSNSSRAQLIASKTSLPARKGKRRQRRSDCMQTMVQKLFNTCQSVFAEGTAGYVPKPEGVARIRSVLDSLKPVDVGLSPKLSYFRNTNSNVPPPITYLHVYECREFSIGIFCLPPSAVIPLHNHPGMTVFSKILFGSMHIKSYDWLMLSQDSIKPSHVVLPSGERLAKVKTNAVFTAPCEVSILYPSSGGNMHCFTAKTACAVLDVLGPPYAIPERNCTYYHDHAFAKHADESPLDLGEGEGYSWLQERAGRPEELLVVGAEYKGPNIVET